MHPLMCLREVLVKYFLKFHMFLRFMSLVNGAVRQMLITGKDKIDKWVVLI